MHLDLDVLDPRVMPGLHWPVEGGFSDGGLRTLLAEVAEAAQSHRRRGHRPAGAGPGPPGGHDRRAAAAVTDVVALVGRTSDRAHGRAAGARRWPAP